LESQFSESALSQQDSIHSMPLPSPHTPVEDALGRPIQDLRISVIDNCNMRCTYCMPREQYGDGYAFLRQHELLSFDEMLRLVRVFVQLGVSKVRITGGEPLLRKGLPEWIGGLMNIDGLDDIALTTNGLLLPRMATQLVQAGLRRITVSLDALDDEVFGAMNGRGIPVGDVLAGIRAAREAGFETIKINAVIQRGVNDDQIIDTARYFREEGAILRFIEYMDVGTRNGWSQNDVVPSREIHDTIHDIFPLESAERNYRGEVASRYMYQDGTGEIGFISSVTDTFCGDCTRARVSANGVLYTCLFANEGADLKALLRDDITDAELYRQLASIWGKRTDRYSELRTMLRSSGETADKVEMNHIGG
jgi:GTP 3',8-cyclase